MNGESLLFRVVAILSPRQPITLTNLAKCSPDFRYRMEWPDGYSAHTSLRFLARCLSLIKSLPSTFMVYRNALSLNEADETDGYSLLFVFAITEALSTIFGNHSGNDCFFCWFFH